MRKQESKGNKKRAVFLFHINWNQMEAGSDSGSRLIDSTHKHSLTHLEDITSYSGCDISICSKR